MTVILDGLIEWAKGQAEVAGILLVGSHARGTARAGSDIDLVILVEEKARYLEDLGWLGMLGFGDFRVSREEWGVMTSLRVTLKAGLEIELGLVTKDWAETRPIDSGTFRVVRDGARILCDPHDLLAELVQAVRAQSTG